MNQLKIKIQTLEDANEVKSVMPELQNKDAITTKEMTVCILEDMTKEHQAGISFVHHHANGTHSAYMITENNMDALIGAYNGAKQRFAKLAEDRKK